MQTLFAAEEVFHSETAKVNIISQTVDENDSFLQKETFSVCKKDDLERAGLPLHDLLIHHLSL